MALKKKRDGSPGCFGYDRGGLPDNVLHRAFCGPGLGEMFCFAVYDDKAKKNCPKRKQDGNRAILCVFVR
ncbi:hypothetical protein TH19_03025 [Thalassospira profundimaris]|uniref:Uncharacterized protein n=1 Tax=Thalassospira profundimaris TaxID=502049 RepID=A0A367WE55_9PROT|nr:hypothetical protein TH19_03025 [Thalassospira profundimaris]